jgi:hypothetical protein
VDPAESAALAELDGIDPDTLSPRDALALHLQTEGDFARPEVIARCRPEFQ